MKMRRIGPNPVFVKQVAEVLAQNRRILEMNAQIVRAIMSPPCIVSGDVKIDVNALRSSGIVRAEET